MRTLTTLNDIFFRVAFETGPRAILTLDAQGAWQPMAGEEVYRRTAAFARALASWGLKKGDRVALISENRWEWAVTDFACLAAGIVDVPIFPTLQAPLTGDLLAHSGARVAVVSTRAQYKKLAEVRSRTSIERVITLDEVPDADAVTFEQVLAQGGALPFTPPPNAEPWRDAAFEAAARAITPDDLATIIYTSGTTADPKGVMLTHGNIAQNLNYSLREFTFLPGEDSSVSFLPLSHVTARHVDYALYSEKVAIAYVAALDKLLPAVRAVQPTFFVAVPRVYEKIRQETERKASKSAASKRIVAWALKTGSRHRDTIARGERPRSLSWALADRLFYSKLRAAFGGKVRHYIAGGAPLGYDTTYWFLDAGIRILEGYGLTETSPVLGVNTPPHCRPGSVGKVLPNIQAKIAEDGELLVRGPNVFSGYWNAPELTAQAFDEQGFFMTGDIARIDEDGYLFITDRKKELIKTSAGKLVAPQPIEGKLKADLLVAQAALVGDKQKYVAALISPNFPALEEWAAGRGITAGTRNDLVAHPEVLKRYRETIKRVNTTLADYELVKNVAVVAEEWTPESGELTPSLKLKRRVLADQYREQIAALFR